ncbi:MAG TPA: ethanolamine ammonia-lyase reactivating factor EutA [Methylomirabilota bacterium]|jgi:ethanolamine utilization protein EutA|nr:ethanolamine ammonia-lyase reactivating factor EutA [Methylomirabilota bacterium]
MHDFPHSHEHDAHEGDPVGLPDEADPVWAAERIELRSVGIDIGSSTSHLTFSRLVLRRLGLSLSSRYRVVERDVVHQSPILLTPYRDPVTIDAERLAGFVDDAYRRAGLSREAIDTGAVIVTGEAAKKTNAEAILGLFARDGGRFVCATAGPRLEAIMAAHGSGAVARSRQGGAVLNVDVGGGTSKLALCRDGEVVDTAVINVGGRLVAWEDGRVSRLEEAGAELAETAGGRLALGDPIDEPARAALLGDLVARMVECLFEVIDRRPLSPLSRRLMHTAPLARAEPVTALMFSGGVAEYVYGREPGGFGDLGRMLGEAVRRRLTGHPLGPRLVEADEGIRATVIGAAQYTVQVSGSTIFHPRPGLVLRNLPVFPVRLADPLTATGVARAVQTAMAGHDPELLAGPLALAIRWEFGSSYEELRALGEGILAAIGRRDAPVVLAFDRDIARLVGRLLVEELGAGPSLVAVDELDLAAFDYIDVGDPLPVSGIVPVVIKSLVFRPVPVLEASEVSRAP